MSAARRRLAGLSAFVAASAIAVGAWAIWSAAADATSRGAAVAASVNQGATPSASAAPGRAVTVTWGASTLTGGHAVDGYVVKRYDAASGTAQTVLSGCAGTITATSCTEAGVPPGAWKYSVTPVIGTNWQGPESAQSGTATVAAATLSLAKTLFGATLPEATTGAIAGFAANEAVSYRLDAGTTLTGAPSAVGSTGAATITSLTIPSTTDGAHTVYAVGGAVPFASVASTGIVVDTTAPTVTAALSPAANGAGWNSSAPVLVTLTAGDGTGSGVAQVKYTTNGSDPTTSGTVYSAAISVSVNTTVKYFATDNAGNASGVQTQLVKVDAVAPANALSLSGVTGGAFASGGTIYYRGAAAGSFTLTNAVSDAGGSGPASSATAALAGTTTGWSHASSLVSTPAGGPYVSNPFSWSAGTASAPTESVTGSDVAANSTTAVLGFANDSTAPSGGGVDATGLAGTGARYSPSQTLHPAFTKGTDAGSGLAGSGSQLLRATATLSSTGAPDGTCGAYGAYAAVGSNDPVSPVTDNVPTDNQCYRYEYLVPDNVGNMAAYTSPDIKIETAAPGSLTPSVGTITPVTGTAAQFVSGSTVYYNPVPAGSFTVDSVAGDVHSGVAQMAFPTLGGFSGGGAVTTPTGGTTFRATYGWSGNAGSASPGVQSLTASSNAGASSLNASAFSVVKDATAPSGGSVDASGLVGRYSTSTTLSIAFAAGSDAGSGLAATGAQLLRASATLTSAANADGACGTYGAYVQVGANDPSSPKSDAGLTDHACYRYEYMVADRVGNATTYTSPDIKVDTTAPAAPTLVFSAFANSSATGTVVYYRPGAANGSFTTTASSIDLFSGLAGYAFPALPSGWTAAAGGLGVEAYSYAAPNPTAPSGNQNVTATNHAGQTSTPSAFTVVGDSTAPSGGSVSFTSGYYPTASISVTFAPGTDGGSGVDAASGLLQRASATLAAGACGSFGAFATIAANPGSPYADGNVTTASCYEYRYVISDGVGNQATYTTGSIAKVDTDAPSQALSLTSPAAAWLSGATLYYKGNGVGSFKFLDVVTDAASGVASATFPSIAAAGWTHATETQVGAGPFTSTLFSWTATPTNPAGFAVNALDNAGNNGSSAITFVSDTTAPAGGSISYTNGIVNALSIAVTTANGTDTGGSGVNAASGIIRRDQATLTTSTETCGTFLGTFATTVTLVGGADTSVTSGHCYQYEYLLSDNVGNLATSTSASVAKVDTSGPIVTAIVSQQSGGGAGDGTLELGDKLILTFNQSLAPASVESTFVGAAETRGSSLLGVIAPHVQLTIPGITLGALDTGTPGYFVDCLALCQSRVATFAGSVALANGGTSTTVTVTVTALTGDTPSSGNGALAFFPATAITDGGGDAASGTLTTATTFKLF